MHLRWKTHIRTSMPKLVMQKNKSDELGGRRQEIVENLGMRSGTVREGIFKRNGQAEFTKIYAMRNQKLNIADLFNFCFFIVTGAGITKYRRLFLYQQIAGNTCGFTD